MAVNFDSYLPFDDGPGANTTETGWRAMMRRMTQTGVLRNVLSELRTFGDSTGMQVKTDTGQVMIAGHWGEIASQKTQAIATADATNPRRDLVVARCHFGNNEIELDVITGTPAAGTPTVPSLTQNTIMWEIPLAVVHVGAGVSTISAANCLDARQWGGPLNPTVMDDSLLFGDKVSSCQRGQVNGNAATVNTNTYFVLMQTSLDQVVSNIKFYVTTARSGGTAECKIFYNGWRQDMFYSSVTPTITNFGTTTGAITTGTFSPISLRAGELVCVMMRFASTSVAPVFAGLDVSSGIGANANVLLNGGSSTHMTCGFKATTMPTTPLNIIDGTWSTRDRYFWCALT